MKKIIDDYKNYIIAAAIGLLILIFAGSGTSNVYKNNNEKNFINVMESVKGVGKISLITNKSKDGLVNGVVIVAQGANNIEIKQQITDAAVAAFGVLPHQVQVFSK